MIRNRDLNLRPQPANVAGVERAVQNAKRTLVGIIAMASSDALPGPRRPRPLSPHLGIYRFTMTMAMSIAHRISGAALYVGVLLLAWFLISASADAGTFAVFSEFIQSFV